jgi:hypothetical protein
MKRKSIQKINFSSDQYLQLKVVTQRKHMPIVRCKCGSEILVIPDLKAMNNAINNHISKHKKTHDNLERLAKSLTEQVLSFASKINLPNAS